MWNLILRGMTSSQGRNMNPIMNIPFSQQSATEEGDFEEPESQDEDDEEQEDGQEGEEEENYGDYEDDEGMEDPEEAGDYGFKEDSETEEQEEDDQYDEHSEQDSYPQQAEDREELGDEHGSEDEEGLGEENGEVDYDMSQDRIMIEGKKRIRGTSRTKSRTSITNKLSMADPERKAMITTTRDKSMRKRSMSQNKAKKTKKCTPRRRTGLGGTMGRKMEMMRSRIPKKTADRSRRTTTTRRRLICIMNRRITRATRSMLHIMSRKRRMARRTNLNQNTLQRHTKVRLVGMMKMSTSPMMIMAEVARRRTMSIVEQGRNIRGVF
jgi:hypothetical protein